MTIQSLAIIGTGTMGMGIAQIASQAGILVKLFDNNPQSAKNGVEKLSQTLNTLQNKGKLTAEQVSDTLNRLEIIDNLSQLADVDMVIEAIIEKLDIKQSLFTELETIVSDDCILASNTSSLSITAIASVCSNPKRVVGYHFFNPVPLMKVVEVIAGLQTDEKVVQALLDLSTKMGHLGVKAKDTPGFIVNHAGRAFGTESLKILGETVAPVPVIDRILRDGAGFRMGSFELMDLTALDVSHPVMESIYNQYYQEPRYRPHPLTGQMLVGKFLGKKVGQGFYRYEEGKKVEQNVRLNVKKSSVKSVWIGADFDNDKQILTNYCQEKGINIDTDSTPKADSLIILATYGEDTTTSANRFKVDARRAVAIDMLTDFAKHRTLMPSIITQSNFVGQAVVLFDHDNGVSVIGESAGFVAQRVLATVVNLSCEMAQQNIATPSDIDNSVRIGLGYPLGALSWGDKLGADKILLILQRIVEFTHDPRYRPSAWLIRRVAHKLSLLANSPTYYQ